MKKRTLLCILAAVVLFLAALPLAAEEAEEPVVSTLFYETDIREALNEVMLQTGVNIIYDDTVRGTVTLDLDDVPLSRALRMMLIAGGYTYTQIDDFYLVGLPDPRSPAFKEHVQTEEIRLHYITASTATSLLPGFYSDFVNTSAERENVLTITAPEAIIDRFKDDLALIDTRGDQVLIHVLVTEVSTEVLKERGTDLLQLLSEGTTDDTYSIELARTLGVEAAGLHGRLLAEMRALEREEKATIRANPRILVADRESAELFVGEEQVIVLEPADAAARIERVDVGVSLSIRPEVLNESELRLSVEPDISHFTEERLENLVVRRSELSTTVYARNNETLTLGGMTLEEETGYESKVPILGDIPILRWFFRRTTEREGERELMIFITPEIKGAR